MPTLERDVFIINEWLGMQKEFCLRCGAGTAYAEQRSLSSKINTLIQQFINCLPTTIPNQLLVEADAFFVLLYTNTFVIAVNAFQIRLC